MKDGFNKFFNCILDGYRTSKTRIDYHLLSPCTIPKDAKSYEAVEALIYAIIEKKCRNVALTGIYGSGKSSIIDTFVKEIGEKNVLKISLSTYLSQIDTNPEPNEIEYNIFQQIFYKSDENVTSLSKFATKQILTQRMILWIALCILLFIISVIILFEPDFLRVESIYNMYYNLLGYNIGKLANNIFDIMSLLFILICLGIFIYKFIFILRRYTIKKISTKNIEFECEESLGKSIFNICLYEIINFIKKCNYKVIVFEDLDRIQNPKVLFLKLREINNLLNESHTFLQKKRSVAFLYAIKDDVFTNEIRTKFFDFIVPVIPVVDKFNAGDYLIGSCGTIFKEVKDSDLSRLGIYISSMRELKNIINEFILYKVLITTSSMSQTKLLAMVIYKNLYPDDYAEIYYKKGVLYNLFLNKQCFADLLLERNKQSQEQDELDNEIVVRNKSFKELIKMIDNGELILNLIKKVCNECNTNFNLNQVELLHSFIRNEYIAEDYNAYISYNHNGSLQQCDFDFIHSVLQGIPNSYNYPLTNILGVIKALNIDNFSHSSILNYNLVEYIFQNGSSEYKNVLLKTICTSPEFIVGFSIAYPDNKEIINAIFDGWKECVKSIDSISDEELKISLYRLYFSASDNVLTELTQEEITILQGKYNFICDNINYIDYNRVIKIISDHGIKFTRILTPNDQTLNLYNYIIESWHFVISYEKLKTIYGENFDKQSYTEIINGSYTIKNYIERENQYMISKFSDHSNQESEEAMIKLLKNTNIIDDVLEPYIDKQIQKISTLKLVNEDRYELLLKLDKIFPTWDNVNYYFLKTLDLDGTINFIRNHVDDLTPSKNTGCQEELKTQLFTNNDVLSIEEFQKLLPCFNVSFGSSEIVNLNEKRLLLLLQNNCLSFDYLTFNFFAKLSSEILSQYMMCFFDDVINYEFDIPDICKSNEIGIKMLNSSLTLNQKELYLNKIATLDIESSNTNEYANLICYYYNQIGINKNSDIDLIIEALTYYKDDSEWHLKISLLNLVNRNVKYNKDNTTRMINALGGQYLKLNTYRGNTYFDNNVENRELLKFLKENQHYVNNIKDEGYRLKVTFKSHEKNKSLQCL